MLPVMTGIEQQRVRSVCYSTGSEKTPLMSNRDRDLKNNVA